VLLKDNANRERIVAGLMSGTSVDAIDVAITRISPSGPNIDVEVIAYREFPWSSTERDAILSVSTNDVSAQMIAVVDRLIGERFSDALAALVEPIGVTIDAIGFHGQTVAHVPVAPVGFAPSTLQLGNPHACARVFRCPVVFDFRRADMLSGGQGAPLVPAADSLMFHREVQGHPIAIQNIGGVGNVTYLAPKSAPIGFDTGPGNMVLDQVMAARTNKLFDRGGEVAASGVVIREMLNALNRWHQPIPPPVSYGREHFGPPFVNRLLTEWGNEETADIMATVSEWTATTITNAFQQLPSIPERIFMAGGGAKNSDLIARLERLLGRRFQPLDHLGITSDAREAVAFAVLADARLRGVAFDLSRVTGSQVPQGLGAIALP
jgi:anhydro-N-acetylmuramic acid kinase